MDDLYQQELLDLYRKPHNFGDLAGLTCKITETNASCGDSLTLQLKLEDAVVVRAKFVGDGCAVSVAAMSLLTDYIQGKSIHEIAQIDMAFMQKLMGMTVSPGRIKCLTLGARALMRLLNQALENSDSAGDQ